MGRNRRPKWALARVSGQRAPPLVCYIVLRDLSRGKRGCNAVVKLHKVLVTGGEGLLGLLDGAQHLRLLCNIPLHLTHILVDLIFRVWHQGCNEVCKLVIPLVTPHQSFHEDLVLLTEIGSVVL